MKEHDEQVALFKWARAQTAAHHELGLLFAIPNGGHRNKITAAKLKAEGVKAGVPDICLPVARGGFHALYIELKRPKEKGVAAGKLSEEQEAWLYNLLLYGNAAFVCYGWEEAAKVLASYLGGGVVAGYLADRAGK